MSEFTAPKILQTQSDYLLAFILLLGILSFTLTHHYQNYLTLKSYTWQNIDAVVLQQSLKKETHSSYYLLELKSHDLHFYTRSKDKLRDLTGRTVSLAISTDNISFKGFLTRFFTYSKLLEVTREKHVRFQLIDHQHRIHKDQNVANLYGALFWVEPISKSLREKLSALGINHLAALSGFHLGFLAVILIFVLKLLLRPVQEYFYPYWHLRRIIMTITLIMLFLYAYFLEFTPSLIRSYVMIFLIYLFYDRGIQLRSFALLLLTVLAILALFPYLLFSLAFWFSVLGVMMIFLFLNHYHDLSKWKLALVINFGVFILMAPFIFYVFDSASSGQFLSPFLSLAFSLFYPLALLIHILHMPILFDDALISLFSWDFTVKTVAVDHWMAIPYFLALTISIYSQRVFQLLLVTSTLFLLYVIAFL